VQTIADQVRNRRLEEELSEQARKLELINAIEKYVPPEATLGLDVNFYEHGDPLRIPIPAKVVNIRGKGIDLSLFGSFQVRTAIRYIYDPAMQNPNIRQEGCWSFTDQHLVEQTWREEMGRRVEELSAKVEALEKSAGGKKSSATGSTKAEG